MDDQNAPVSTLSPRPWKVEDRFWDGERCIVDATGACIAGPRDMQKHESCTIVEGINEKDAALMAEAPNLLRMLEQLIDSIDLMDKYAQLRKRGRNPVDDGIRLRLLEARQVAHRAKGWK